MSNSNISSQETILVYVDSSRDEHLALECALRTSKVKSLKPKLHVCITGSGDEGEITQSIKSAGLEFTCEYYGSKSDYESVLDCAERIHPNLMLIPDYDEGVRIMTAHESTWGLPRKELCPAMILSAGANRYSKYGFTFEKTYTSNL